MANFNIIQSVTLPEKRVPIISIGAGGIVHDAHYPAYKKAGFILGGIYDRDQKRAAEMAATFAVPQVFASLDDAIKGAPLDAVFDVALPASAILAVLPHIPDGRGVLIQKPMGNNLAEARQILDLCHSKHLIAAINFQMRYAPYILAARSLIEQGAIGDLHDMEARMLVYTPWQLWTFLVGIPRMEILYHSIHYIDLMRSFLGEPQGVYAKTLKHPKQPQLASTRSNIILDYGDTLRANITTNHGHEFGSRHQESYVKWEGTHGAIKAKVGVNLNYPQGEPDDLEYCILEDGQSGQVPQWQTVPLSGTWFPDAFIGTMASLMRFIEGSSNVLPTSVDDAYKTMAVVEAAYNSSAANTTPIPA
ncbi:MAG: Gfo/Idh/MocA family oxidoreductase [Chloroflexota bacterium]